MSDADLIKQRREARRRRILENSEGRLKKLLGEIVTVNGEENCNVSTTTQSSPNSVTSSATYTPNSVIKREKSFSLIAESKETENESKRDDETVPALSTRHLLGNLTEEIDFYDVMTRSRSNDVTLQATPVEESSMERLQRTSTDEIIITRERANNATRNYLFANPKIRRGFYAVFAVFIYLTLTLDVFLYVIGKSIILPFICVEFGVISYELFFVPRTSIPVMNTAHTVLNGALILSGVPESLIVKISTLLSYMARVWEEFSIFFFTFLLFHWLVMEVVFMFA